MKKIELVGWGFMVASLILVSLSIPLGAIRGLFPAIVGATLMLVGFKILSVSGALEDR